MCLGTDLKISLSERRFEESWRRFITLLGQNRKHCGGSPLRCSTVQYFCKNWPHIRSIMKRVKARKDFGKLMAIFYKPLHLVFPLLIFTLFSAKDMRIYSVHWANKIKKKKFRKNSKISWKKNYNANPNANVQIKWFFVIIPK